MYSPLLLLSKASCEFFLNGLAIKRTFTTRCSHCNKSHRKVLVISESPFQRDIVNGRLLTSMFEKIFTPPPYIPSLSSRQA